MGHFPAPLSRAPHNRRKSQCGRQWPKSSIVPIWGGCTYLNVQRCMEGHSFCPSLPESNPPRETLHPRNPTFQIQWIQATSLTHSPLLSNRTISSLLFRAHQRDPRKNIPPIPRQSLSSLTPRDQTADSPPHMAFVSLPDHRPRFRLY